MKKLWQKNWKLDKVIEAFETKGDLLLDQKLVAYDVQGSIAHAKMLYKIGILTEKEFDGLHVGLQDILKLHKAGKFVLKTGDEDMHTKIENYLTKNYGDVGKKIHTARSRNDQVLTALRLYSKAEITKIQKEIQSLIEAFKTMQSKYGSIPMPGYTHMQKAMPSTIGLWVGSYIDSLSDDKEMINAAYELIDQSPLGSAAGYGVSIPLDRKFTAEILGFKNVQENPLYCQHSRGKFEAAVLASLTQTLLTINKFASDALLFTTGEFDFFHVAQEITTGSSIMPQKRNLDVAELLRSKVHIVLGNYTQIVSLNSNLISGYNRDIQDSKKPFMESLDITLQSLKVATILVDSITPNKKKLKVSMTNDLFATEQVLKLVLLGDNFRDSYQKIGKKYTKG
ncbi:MAG TPA: argininosuccinate lyase [Patescibacteria group bacterium]|nr:argininosuccinate lyase [Patescibacteria group bacterium]